MNNERLIAVTIVYDIRNAGKSLKSGLCRIL